MLSNDIGPTFVGPQNTAFVGHNMRRKVLARQWSDICQAGRGSAYFNAKERNWGCSAR